MDLRPVDPAEPDAVETLTRLLNEAQAVDAPHEWASTPGQVRANLTYGWDLDPSQFMLAQVDGEPVGWASYQVSKWDNPHMAHVSLGVLPAYRRRGLGSRVLDALVARSREDGCRTAMTHGWDSSPAAAFADARGWSWAAQALNGRQHLADLDPGTLRDALATARAAASEYDVERLAGRTPADLLPELAQVSASINDAPLDDLDLDDEDYSPERVEAYETAQELRGDRLYRVLARERSTGRLGGHTVVVVEGERPEIGHQHDTAVAREHRGHRLGLLVKAELATWLAEAEPQLRTLDTFNAESNTHMLAVNAALGYRPVGRIVNYQLTL